VGALPGAAVMVSNPHNQKALLAGRALGIAGGFLGERAAAKHIREKSRKEY